MRKLLVLAALASAAITLAVSIPARASAADSSFARSSASGSGTLAQFGDPTVLVKASETAVSGVQGQFAVTYPDGTAVSGRATCVFVSGTTAYLTGQITVARGPRTASANWFPGGYIVIGVMDNGGAPRDLLNFSPGFAVNPGCGPNFAATPVFPTVKGRYLVEAN